MSRYTYDLHVHSCLSPCADNDNTPNNLAGMAVLNNIQILALTDHNSCRNCPAFFTACKRYGIIPIPGMELTTSEDIHVVCLFPELEDALEDALESDAPVLTLELTSPDDLEDFAACQYLITKPLCLRCADAELLEQALRLYQGRALYDGPLDEKALAPLAAKYGVIY